MPKNGGKENEEVDFLYHIGLDTSGGDLEKVNRESKKKQRG
jgi:hypothetical protein